MPEQPRTDRLAAALDDLEDAANWLRGVSDAPGLDEYLARTMRVFAVKLDAARETVAEARDVLAALAALDVTEAPPVLVIHARTFAGQRDPPESS